MHVYRMQCVCVLNHVIDVSRIYTSLVSRPFEEEEKGPGTHCLHMLRYPKNLRGLNTIVNYSASLICTPVCDIIVHLPFKLLCARASYPQTFVFLLCFTYQYFLSTCAL